MILSKFYFKVIWSTHCLGIAVDKKLKNNTTIPLTSFFFWPRVDGWKLLKHELELKPWLIEKERIEILNGYTKIISIWKNNFKNEKVLHFSELEKDFNFLLIGIE